MRQFNVGKLPCPVFWGTILLKVDTPTDTVLSAYILSAFYVLCYVLFSAVCMSVKTSTVLQTAPLKLRHYGALQMYYYYY